MLAHGSLTISRMGDSIFVGGNLHLAYEIGEFAVVMDEVFPYCFGGFECKKLFIEGLNEVLMILCGLGGSLGVSIEIDKPIEAVVNFMVDGF